MTKKMCKAVKKGLVKDDLKAYKKLVKDAKFVCKSCGRTAAKSAHLCKPDDL